jgi:hypothetical protein
MSWRFFEKNGNRSRSVFYGLVRLDLCKKNAVEKISCLGTFKVAEIIIRNLSVPDPVRGKNLSSDKLVLAFICDLMLPMSVQKLTVGALNFACFYYTNDPSSTNC